MKLSCWSCKREIDLPDKVGFRDICPDCSAYLHSCVQCRLYVKENCTEPSAEKVRDPEGGNYCDFFQVRGPGVDDEPSGDKKSEAEAMWAKLTGKS